MDWLKEEKKKFSVNDSIWIAVAVMSYEKYYADNARNIAEYSFGQSDIRKRAEEINGAPVEAARTSQWVCGDHENHTYSYLRAVGVQRRLSCPGEFNGDKEEPTSLSVMEIVPTSLGEISVQQLLDFVHKEYAEMVSQVIEEVDIDYIGVLDYLRDNSEQPYSNPEAKGLPAEKKARLLNLKQKGQTAVGEMKKMADIFGTLYGLDKCLPMSWLDGSNTKTRKYLWAQLKYSAYADNPVSVSVFVEKNGKDVTRYRISLEIKNDGTDKAMMAKYHSFLDLPLNESAGLVYVSGSNEWGYPSALDETQDVIKKDVEDGKLKKVQISKYVERKPDETNEYFHAEITKAIEAIIPYYEHVVGKGQESPIYWPSLDEYNPGITVEKWIELLNDSSVTWDVNLRMLLMMLECGGESTCANLAELYGGTAGAYNAWGSSFADRVHKATNCPLCMDGDRERVYTVAFVGRNVMEKGHDRYSWKLRDELKEALESDMINKKGIEQLKEFRAELKKVQYAKNMILYGPPGTGKTYNSAIYAVAICDEKKVEDLTDYDAVMARYEELKAEGRIAFTTFHQSYGYEEFIEGIAPVIDSDVAASDVMYKYKDGVFKEFCKKAAGTASTKKLNQITNSNPSVWKVSLKNTGDNEVRTECLENGHIRIGWDEYGEDISAITEYTMGGKNILDAFMNKMQIGDIVVSCYSQTTVDAIGVITGEPEWGTYGDYNRVRKVEWIIKGIDEDITVINKGKQLSDPTIHGLDMSESDITSFIEKIENAQSSKPYVFVIDEINRGNISKIFGELITLIEATKRAGMPEAIEAKLPYTQKPFSVPANVYILGTMNTADRSIALMDTALRRRFQFVEMMPETDVLRKIGADKVETLDVAAMLETINERITFLYDREHTIGHAFFTGLAEEPSVEKLASIFEKSVIPLLQEYFYEDYQKIQLVLGDNGKSDEAYKFIKDIPVVAKNIFKGSVEDVIDLPEKKYEINKDAFKNIQSYIEII